MQPYLLLILFTLTLVSCKNEVKILEDQSTPVLTSHAMSSDSYPKELQEVFKAHGQIQQWKEMNNMCYEISGRNGKEIHTVSLKDRRVKIETEKWTIGYDGNEVWVLQNKADSYKGNARFYHNLMFYFYAMPFVLGDDGINYSETRALEFDGTTYPGIKITYGEGVGDSPKDEYVLYYHPTTHKMEWLGYTVTYRDNEKSDQWHFIKYGDWQSINDLLLPKALTWYETENNLPIKERNTMQFEKVVVTSTTLDDAVFEMPENATVAKR